MNVQRKTERDRDIRDEARRVCALKVALNKGSASASDSFEAESTGIAMSFKRQKVLHVSREILQALALRISMCSSVFFTS